MLMSETACILMSTWETQLTASTFGLTNGGLAGLVWMYLITFAGFIAVVASMAEMASMRVPQRRSTTA